MERARNERVLLAEEVLFGSVLEAFYPEITASFEVINDPSSLASQRMAAWVRIQSILAKSILDTIQDNPTA
ncbi:hypothetical protein H8D30_01190 [bacterium]|nr:hypothetical protein [bacterium]